MLRLGGLVATQLGGMSALPYYLHRTQNKSTLIRSGITIGSMCLFGYYLPLKICHKILAKYSSKTDNKPNGDNKKQKPKPMRAILMLYVCVWLYKVIEMNFQPNFFQRCNITKPWQSIIAAFVPGVFLFDPKLKSMPNYNWKPRTLWKLAEFISYGLIMFTEIKICQKYSNETLNKLPHIIQHYMFYAFIASWIQMQNNMLPLIASFILKDNVYITFPYKTAILSSGWQDYWKRWSVSIGSALRYTIYYPLIKNKKYHPLIGILAVFAFNAFMHHWFAILLEDNPHFEGYCVGMCWGALATFVETYLKRTIKTANNSKRWWLFFFLWHHFTMFCLAKIMIWKYRVIDITVEDLKGDDLT
eukprot:254011_1